MDVNQSAYDRVLIALVLIAPLAMLGLSKWRASLDQWYAPPNGGAVFGKPFQQKVSRWVAQRADNGAELILIVDRDCPCTRSTVDLLQKAHARSKIPGAELIVHDMKDQSAFSEPEWRAMLLEIPSTPTLLVIDKQRLIYVGPVTSGNFCTTAVNRVLGISALVASPNSPVLNWLDKGCYCRLTSGKV